MNENLSTNTNALQHKSVGIALRDARNHLGYSLAEVATVTRIPRNMLENLEDDRFAEYSASVFARGHLVNYARELRLDPMLIMQKYEQQTGKVAKTPSIDYSPSSPTPNVKPPTQTRRFQMAQRPGARWGKAQFGKFAEVMRPRHMAGLVLILCALFAAVSFVGGNRATAQNPSEFPKASKNEWNLERDVEKTRWLLEQPAALPGKTD